MEQITLKRLRLLVERTSSIRHLCSPRSTPQCLASSALSLYPRFNKWHSQMPTLVLLGLSVLSGQVVPTPCETSDAAHGPKERCTRPKFQGSPIRRNPTHGSPSHLYPNKSHTRNASCQDQPSNPIIVRFALCSVRPWTGLYWRYAKQVESVSNPDSCLRAPRDSDSSVRSYPVR